MLSSVSNIHNCGQNWTMIVTVAMMWFRKKVAMRKKKAVKSIQQYRKRRYIPRTPKVLKKYQESNWSKMLQLGRCQDPSSKDGKLFRRRFRIPYPLFLEIVEVVRNKNWFPEVDCTGAPSVPEGECLEYLEGECVSKE